MHHEIVFLINTAREQSEEKFGSHPKLETSILSAKSLVFMIKNSILYV